MSYTLYILHTSSDTYYTGITTDPERRLSEHRNKSPKSAKYMRAQDDFSLVYTESLPDRSSALKREYHIKQLTKQQKQQLITKSNQS